MRPLLTPAWLLRHGIALLLVLACGVLAWWQVTRAVDGNMLSYGYAVLWPVFGLFVLLIWWREVRLAVRGPQAPAQRVPAEGFRAPVVTRRVTRDTPADDDADDGSLAAYNEYLAWLRENPGARPADYPRSK